MHGAKRGRLVVGRRTALIAGGAVIVGCGAPGVLTREGDGGTRVDGSTPPSPDAGTLAHDAGASPLVDRDGACTTPVAERGDWPAWRQALELHTITDITADGSTAASAFRAAGYDLPGWRGDATSNLSAWAGGALAPLVGPWGSMLCGSNGHESEPASTIHRFDLATATWTAPIGRPRIHRQVAPDYLPPPADAECWYNPDNHGDLPVYASWEELVAPAVPVTTPHTIGAYSFAYWPHVYGCRYDTDVGAAMRYDNYAIIPPSCGGDALGTLAFVAPGVAHELNAAGTGTAHTWRFGLGAAEWLPVSLDRMNDADFDPHYGTAAYGIGCITSFSEKYQRVFTASGSMSHLGIYDPHTNAHARAKCNQDSSAYATEGAGCVTEEHEAHLMICVGISRGSGEKCLWVSDLDEVMAAEFPAGDAKTWALLGAGAGDADPALRRVPLLTPGITWSGAYSWTVGWSRRRQRLILFQGPPIGGATGTPHPATIHVITIPTGSTGGVPHWQTEPWTVESPQLALGAGTAGIHNGVVAHGYERFSWSDDLDCAIWVGAPESAPVQAIRLF
jgi:hypothetical protein